MLDIKSAFAPHRQAWWIAALGLAALYLPTLRDLFSTVWATDEQGHGPIVLGLSVWLIWRKWSQIDQEAETAPEQAWGGWALLALGLLLYLFGRSQRILSAQTFSAILSLMGVLWLVRGRGAIKSLWFPLFFMLFMVPLPAALVDAVTQPMKLAVSSVASDVMYALGYPVARTGVILQVGPYQLLVADACAGLHTLFTLEAMGLLYLNVVRHSSVFRNIALAILIVPISFSANVVRVIALSLITFHFGDAAGQGFLHGFAGMVLFMSALILIIATDTLLRSATDLLARRSRA
ncbi:exosortase B [Ideonella sp.]|uniref:exosortase B n=1 Tax=Ideonella sp. TaxID=1929293 RepID=UPI003BB6AC38